MESTQKLEAVKTAVAKFGFTAALQGDKVVVRTNKGITCGTVSADGTIERLYQGRQALMGALVRDAIAAAINAGGAR